MNEPTPLKKETAIEKPKWGWRIEYWDRGHMVGVGISCDGQKAWDEACKWAEHGSERYFLYEAVALRSEQG